MNKFKNINFDASKRKINNWIRNVNSNTIQMGIKKQPELSQNVDIMSSELVISEASSLESDIDIMKRIQKRRKQNKKQQIQKQQIQKQKKNIPKNPPKPSSPLVFLDINKFKHKSFIETPVIIHKPNNKAIQPIRETPKQLVQPILTKSITKKKLIQKTKNIEKYKEKSYKIKTRVKLNNNKKCLEATNRFSLNDIRIDLKNKNINISNKAPEKLTRDLYMICNIHI